MHSDSQWLTIYADAGFGNGIGTYGIWIRIQPGRRTFSGKLPDVTNNNEAEMQAIILARQLRCPR
jgi:ribonuclease HI